MDYPERFENLWLLYREQCRLPGSKRKAFESWEKVGKKWCNEEQLGPPDPGSMSEDEWCKHLRRGFESTVINRTAAKRAGEKLPPLPHMTTWLNQWRFEEQHEKSTGEYKQILEMQHCKYCGTEDDIISGNPGAGIDCVCRECDKKKWGEYHFTSPRDNLMRMLKETPKEPGESWQEWSRRKLSMMPAGRKLLASQERNRMAEREAKRLGATAAHENADSINPNHSTGD